jgi:type I restriction enzyme S subunit
MSWPNVAIDEIFEVARGGSPRPIQKFLTDDPDGINWVMISDASLSNKYITKTKQRIIPEGRKKSRDVKPGDFLLTNSMSFGRPYIMRTTGCIHDGWLLLRPRNEKVDQDFFYHLLGSSEVYARLAARAPGSTVKNLNSDIVRETLVPLPPLEEQKRIAAILDQADNLRRLRQRAIDRLNTLGQAIFYEMFGDPRTNALGWRTKTLGEIGILGRGVSKHRPRNDPVLLGGKHPLVQTGDVANADGFIRTYQATYSDSGLRQSKLWPRGTLCITIAANIGKTAILDFDACFPDSVVGFAPGPDATTEYVQYWFSFIQEKLEREAPQSAQKNINLAILSELEIPLPPVGIQQRFSQCIKEVDSRKLEFKDHLKVSCCLFSSLQHRAFRGEL